MKRAIAQFLCSALIVAASLAQSGCQRSSETENMTEARRVRSGDVDVVLLSPRAGIRHGRDSFFIEFRSASNGQLVNVEAVRMSAMMPMTGMPMFGTVEVQPTGTPGRYAATSEMEMAGMWQMSVQWNGPAGPGSVSFSGTIQ
jgi:hypothetical protein